MKRAAWWFWQLGCWLEFEERWESEPIQRSPGCGAVMLGLPKEVTKEIGHFLGFLQHQLLHGLGSGLDITQAVQASEDIFMLLECK